MSRNVERLGFTPPAPEDDSRDHGQQERQEPQDPSAIERCASCRPATRPVLEPASSAGAERVRGRLGALVPDNREDHQHKGTCLQTKVVERELQSVQDTELPREENPELLLQYQILCRLQLE